MDLKRNGGMSMRILIVEDEEQLRLGLFELLSGKGYQIETAGSLEEAVEKRQCAKEENTPFALYLLDVMLQEKSGFTLCEEIRKTENTPVIFLTGVDDEDSVIKGLEIGGDDYITKPFRSRELLSRIQANLRRYTEMTVSKNLEGQKNFRSSTSVEGFEEAAFSSKDMKTRICLKSGDIVFVEKEERVYLAEEELKLRKVELELLKYFMQNDGLLLRRERILERMWDSVGEFVEDNTLSVQISRLRQKIGKYGKEDYIETVRGMGYRWCQPVEKRERL